MLPPWVFHVALHAPHSAHATVRRRVESFAIFLLSPPSPLVLKAPLAFTSSRRPLSPSLAAEGHLRPRASALGETGALFLRKRSTRASTAAGGPAGAAAAAAPVEGGAEAGGGFRGSIVRHFSTRGGEGIRPPGSEEAPQAFSAAQPETEDAAAAETAAGAAPELHDEGLLLQRPPEAAKQTLGIREYLEGEILPSLVPALTALCEERPPAPVEYLAHYLLENSYRNAQ
ncbi:hypothetical protein Efla_003952 [Eimeria flavescens]